LYGTGVFIEHGANQPSSLSHIAHIAGFCVGIVLIRFLSKPPQTQPSL
jgi:membrane associated rhomboid family serine protease